MCLGKVLFRPVSHPNVLLLHKRCTHPNVTAKCSAIKSMKMIFNWNHSRLLPLEKRVFNASLITAKRVAWQTRLDQLFTWCKNVQHAFKVVLIDFNAFGEAACMTRIVFWYPDDSAFSSSIRIEWQQQVLGRGCAVKTWKAGCFHSV